MHRLRFTRDHRWTPAHMSAYLDGELAASARARLDRHVAECPECRRVFRALRRMLGVLHELTPPSRSATAPDIATAVRRRLDELSRS